MKTGEAIGLTLGAFGLALGGAAFARSRKDVQVPVQPTGATNPMPAHMAQTAQPVQVQAPQTANVGVQAGGDQVGQILGYVDEGLDIFNQGYDLADELGLFGHHE